MYYFFHTTTIIYYKQIDQHYSKPSQYYRIYNLVQPFCILVYYYPKFTLWPYHYNHNVKTKNKKLTTQQEAESHSYIIIPWCSTTQRLFPYHHNHLMLTPDSMSHSSF